MNVLIKKEIESMDYYNWPKADLKNIDKYKIKRKKSGWNRIINISKVPRDTLDKPKNIVNDYITSVKNDAIQELRATVCGKRSERRRALFSKGHAGRGVAGPIRKTKDALSNVRC